MQLLLPIIYTTLFIWVIYKWSFFDIPLLPRLNLIGFFCIKLLAGFSLWAIYTFYYINSDAFEYFRNSEIIYNVIHASPTNYIKLLIGMDTTELQEYYSKIPVWNASFERFLFNDSRTMIRVNAFLRLFSLGNFHVHTVIMCFVSFIGLTALYKTFIPHFKDKQLWLIIGVYFVPTILYWSSGVLKESILVTGLGLLIYSTNCGSVFPKNIKSFLIFALSLLLLVFTKVYVLLIITPPLVANFLSSRFKFKQWLSYAISYSIIVIALFVANGIHSDYNILKIISDKQAKAISEARGGIFLENAQHFICIDYDKSEQLIPFKNNTYKIKQGSSYMEWPEENMQDTTFISASTDTSFFNLIYSIHPSKSALTFNRTPPTLFAFAKNIPFALYHSIFRICFLKPNSVFELIAIVEAQMIFLFILLALFFYKKPSEAQSALIWFCLCAAIGLFLLIGFTVPVMGAMVRYKLPALLFLVVALFLLIDFNKIKGKFSGNKVAFNVSADLK